jgi:hypothetical protein
MNKDQLNKVLKRNKHIAYLELKSLDEALYRRAVYTSSILEHKLDMLYSDRLRNDTTISNIIADLEYNIVSIMLEAFKKGQDHGR